MKAKVSCKSMYLCLCLMHYVFTFTSSLHYSLVNLPGSKSFLQQETNLHRFYTPRTYIKHYQCLKDGGGASGYCNIFRGGGNCAKGSVSTANSGSVDGIESLKRSQSASARFDDEGIEKLLDALRIDLDRRDTICGDVFKKGLNPSEERRLDLGLMVLGAPDTLFCESPVQGLDSETSLHIMEFLKGTYQMIRIDV